MAKAIDIGEWLIEAGEDRPRTNSFFGGSMPCRRNEHCDSLFLRPGTPIVGLGIERHEPGFRWRDERRETTDHDTPPDRLACSTSELIRVSKGSIFSRMRLLNSDGTR